MTVSPTPVSNESIIACADHLGAGELVVVPTDTVYGIAADALNAEAVR
jgi:tRNA A37 threonylcarbamoyladenosine synthetase subunit TsaC/SUA5/YrdC